MRFYGFLLLFFKHCCCAVDVVVRYTRPIIEGHQSFITWCERWSIVIVLFVSNCLGTCSQPLLHARDIWRFRRSTYTHTQFDDCMCVGNKQKYFLYFFWNFKSQHDFVFAWRGGDYSVCSFRREKKYNVVVNFARFSFLLQETRYTNNIDTIGEWGQNKNVYSGCVFL